MSNKPVYYNQNDSVWGKIPYTSTHNPSQTIGSSGCGTTCMAMILSTMVDPTMKPDFTAKLAVDNGFRTVNSGTDFAFFPFIADKYGLQLQESFSTDEAVQALQNGSLVICSMTPGYFTKVGHFILAYDVQNGNIIVNDPAHPDRTQASIDLFKQQCQKYFIFTKEVKPMNLDEAKQVLRDKGISEETLTFLLCYKYGEELIMKLAK